MSKENYGIYRIVSPNGSYYVGMTTRSFQKRREQHRSTYLNNRMPCAGLRRAIKKYGFDNMSFEILEDMTGFGEYEVMRREIFWWKTHKAWNLNVYNSAPTGTGSVRHSEETKRKISESLKQSDTYIEKECIICHKLFIGLRRKESLLCSVSCGAKNTAKKLGQNDNSLTPELEQVSIDLYADDHSLREISRRIGKSHKNISAFLKSQGIEVKRRSGVNATEWKK